MSCFCSVNPDEMASFVWSWAKGEPKGFDSNTTSATAGEGLAVAIAPSSHWVTWNASRPLPVACTPSDDDDDDDDWVVSLSAFPFSDYAAADCPEGYSPAPHPPRNGYANTVLWQAASARRVTGMRSVRATVPLPTGVACAVTRCTSSVASASYCSGKSRNRRTASENSST